MYYYYTLQNVHSALYGVYTVQYALYPAVYTVQCLVCIVLSMQWGGSKSQTFLL